MYDSNSRRLMDSFILKKQVEAEETKPEDTLVWGKTPEEYDKRYIKVNEGKPSERIIDTEAPVDEVQMKKDIAANKSPDEEKDVNVDLPYGVEKGQTERTDNLATNTKSYLEGPVTPIGEQKLRDQASSDMVRVQKAEDELKEMTNVMPNFWAGAAPLLMGMLVGDMSAGGHGGAAGWMQVYKDQMQDERDRLEALRKPATGKPTFKNIIANGRDYATVHRWDGQKFVDTGERVGGVSSDMIAFQEKLERKAANKIKLEKLLGKTKSKFRDPTTGQWMYWDKATDHIKAMQGQTPALAGNQLRLVRDIKKDIQKQKPAIDKYRKMAASVRGFSTMNPQAQRIAFKDMAKALEGGKLSDFDMMYLQGTYSLWKTWTQRLGENFDVGVMDETVRRNFAMELAKAMEEDKKRVQDQYSRYYEDGNMVNLSPEEMKAHVGTPIGLYDYVKYRATSGKNKGRLVRVPISTSNMEKVFKSNAEIIGYE